MTEWYVNREHGLEHGFTIEKPLFEGTSTIQLDLAVGGGFEVMTDADGKSATLRKGMTELRYEGLKVYDATGRGLRAWMETSRPLVTSPVEANISQQDSEGALLSLVFETEGATWPITVDPTLTQVTKLFGRSYPQTTDDNYGTSVAIAGDTAVVGAWKLGVAYVFVRNGDAWVPQAELTVPNGQWWAFGAAVSISGDTILVGANHEGVGANQAGVGGQEWQGAAYVFTRSAGTWTQQAKLIASDGAAYDRFGWSVSISGDTALVGAPLHNIAGAGWHQGAAYVFVRSGGSWTQQQRLVTTSDARSDLSFGRSVSIYGNTAVVGSGIYGVVWVFERSGSAWSPQVQLTAPDGVLFGPALSLSGDTLVVGAPSARPSGAAYVFERNQNRTWSSPTRLSKAEGGEDLFGSAVATSGSAIVIGSRGENAGHGQNEGSAYAFVRSQGVWAQQKLTAPDGVANDRFGISVSIDGPTAFVGSHWWDYYNLRADHRISAYLFSQLFSDYTATVTPTVASPSSSGLTPMTATLKGDVTTDNGSAITERGFVYSLTSANSNPVIGGAGVTRAVVSGTTGVFTTPIAGLTSGVAYSFRAYATNVFGTTYTTAASFTTPVIRLFVNDVSANEGNSGTSTFTFTISLNATLGQTVTVNYRTTDGTATAGSDYVATSGIATISSGQTSTTFTVVVNGDTNLESNESFGVLLANATNISVGRSVGVGTIKDDDRTATANAPARPQSAFHEFFAVDTLETPHVGDFNGDRKTDIITFTRQNPNAIGDVYVALSDGAKFGANTKWHDFFAITTDESVVIGDFNGDGKDDIATWLGKASRQVYVALSTGSGMLTENAWVSSIGTDPTDLIFAGDANGDGKDDLIAFARKQGKVYVALSDGTKFATPTVWHGFFAVSTYERPRVADVNGDGKADIVTFATDSPTAFGDVYVATSDGTQFVGPTGAPNDSSKWHDFFAIRPTEEIRIGDLNGDGRDDFLTFLPPPFAQVYTVFSQGSSMADNVEWPEKVAPLLGGGDTVFTGDVNGDGKADIIIFAQKEGKVFVSLTP